MWVQNGRRPAAADTGRGAGLVAYRTFRYDRVTAALRQGEFVLARRSAVVVGVAAERPQLRLRRR